MSNCNWLDLITIKLKQEKMLDIKRKNYYIAQNFFIELKRIENCLINRT